MPQAGRVGGVIAAHASLGSDREAMEVLALTRFTRLGANSRLRTWQYISRLEQLGVRMTAAPLFPEEAQAVIERRQPYGAGMLARSGLRRLLALLSARRYHAIWLEAECIPLLPWPLERLLLLGAPPVVVDYDDAMFHGYEFHRNRLVRLLMGSKIDRVMAFASVVVAGNQYLADRALSAGARRVEIVPTVLEPQRYETPDRTGRSRLAIGWIGSPTTAAYLQDVAGPLAAAQQRGNVDVLVMGSGELSIPGVDLTLLKWSEEAEVEAAARFDIGIMPLPDTPWTRGKCGYKLIQYMASALPVVASDLGVNSQIVAEGVNGMLASSDAQWKHAFDLLLGDEQLRIRMGKAGRERVLERYSLDITAPRLADILQSVRR